MKIHALYWVKNPKKSKIIENETATERERELNLKRGDKGCSCASKTFIH